MSRPVSSSNDHFSIPTKQKYFALPESPKFSDESADLLSKLICSQEKRLSDANQIKSHPFFKNIDWDHMHERTPPFLPKLESDVDTVNFFGNEEESCGMTLSGVGSKGNVNAMQRDRAFTGNQLSFVGYSFNRHVKLFHAVSPSPKSSMVMAGEVSTHMTMTSKNDGPSADDADTGVVLKSADTLDSAAEMERYSALDAKYRALEEELVLVRQEATLVKDALEKSRLAMSQQRDEKRDLSETVKDLREKLEKKSHDRNEVERAARDSIQREMAEICTEKQRMFDELAAVREELFQHQKRAASYDATIADAQRENATLAELIKSAQQQAKDVIVKKDTIEQDLLRAREQLSAANEAQESLKTKLATVEATCTSMQEQLSASENKLEIERSVSREKLATITEDKLLAELQVAELQTRCDHLTKQLDVLIADSTTKQQDSIQVELDTRNLLTEQLSQVKREKHVLEAQLNDHRETLSATEQQVIRANTQILALEEKLMNASSRNSEETYRLRKAVAEAERNKAAAVDEAEILRVKLAEHSMVREALVEAERLLAEAVQSNNTLAERLVDLEKKHDSLHAEVAHANESNRILEAKLATEQAGNDRMRKQEAESLREKTDMQSDLLVLRTKLDHLLSTQIDAEEYERLSDECNGLRQNVRDFTERYDLLQQKHRQVAEDNIELRRVHENDILERMALNRKMMESTGISPVSATSGMDFDGARKSRGTISKIKGYEQKLQQELARRTAAELELSAVRQTKLMLEKEIEDLRKASFQGDEHTRSTSILSFGGLMRRPSMDSMFKQKRTRPLLFQGMHVKDMQQYDWRLIKKHF